MPMTTKKAPSAKAKAKAKNGSTGKRGNAASQKSARSATFKKGAVAAAGIGGAVAVTRLKGSEGLRGRTLTVSIRELQRKTGVVLRDIAESGAIAIVTERGRPLAYVMPIGEEAWEQYVIANAPDIAESLERANADLREGKTEDLRDVLAELEREA